LILDPIVLVPGYDISDIRVDIIRQTDTGFNDGSGDSDDAPYHPVGFYLGHGLFLDLKDNISFLIPELFNLHLIENFVIEQNNSNRWFKSKITYEKTDGLMVNRYENLIKTRSRKEFSFENSVLSVNEGFLSKYKIIRDGDLLIFKSGKVSNTLNKYGNQFIYQMPLGKKEYRINGNEVFIDSRYFIRHQGDEIKVFRRGLFKDRILLFRIIKSKNKIYIYSRKRLVMEIQLNKNEINVIENRRSKTYKLIQKSTLIK